MLSNFLRQLDNAFSIKHEDTAFGDYFEGQINPQLLL